MELHLFAFAIGTTNQNKILNLKLKLCLYFISYGSQFFKLSAVAEISYGDTFIRDPRKGLYLITS